MTETRSTDPSATDLPLAGLRVLAVEDHAIGRTLLAAMMQPLGVEATIVADGREAIAAAKAATYDVVLIDLGLPDIAGDRLAHDLARTRGTQRARIVAVTGRARPADLPPAIDDWLEKPYSVRELHGRLMAGRPPLERTA